MILSKSQPATVLASRFIALEKEVKVRESVILQEFKHIRFVCGNTAKEPLVKPCTRAHMAHKGETGRSSLRELQIVDRIIMSRNRNVPRPLLTCSVAGRFSNRSASMRDLDAGWKNATSLFWNPEK